ncbi:MAG: glucose 1-dehydrogenase [Chloroflexota bacterium]
MERLARKVAVITGGARGIGKEIALTFAREGADIVIGDIIPLEATEREIKDLGRRVIAVKTDVAVREDVKNLFDSAINNFKQVDILVNNAAIVRRASLLEMTEDIWDAVIDVNLKGTFLCTQAAGKNMAARKYGKIVNVASIGGLITTPGVPANYAASKAGIIQLTKVSARELGPYGINVNAIAPGLVVTEMTHYGRTEAEVEKFIEDGKKSAVLGRVGFPRDIANLALFLASDESSFISGQVIAVDGGHVGLM